MLAGVWDDLLSPFGDFLALLVERRGLTWIDFARQVRQKASTISQIKHGTRRPPLEHGERWAKVLGLEGDEREYFLDRIALLHAPPRVLAMMLPGHPAVRSIRLAIERELAAAWAADCERAAQSRLDARLAAETGRPYDQPQDPSRSATPAETRSGERDAQAKKKP